MALMRDEEAAQVRAVVDDLSAELARLPADGIGMTLSNGAAGVALAHAALARVHPERGHRERAGRALDAAIAGLDEDDHDTGLFDGLTGVGWAIAHLVGNDHPDGDEICASIDDALVEYLASRDGTTPFDLIEGLVGIGVYALERRSRGASTAILERVVELLSEGAQERDSGIAWRSRAEWLDERFRVPDHRDWNLGVAHGTPGVIAFLAAVVDAGDAGVRDRARALLGRTVPWLLAQRLPDPSGAFACGVGERTPARLAWCYGDPAVAIAILLAARAMGEEAWRREGHRIALLASQRTTTAAAGTFDNGLCHGTAGLGHLFQRLYAITGDDHLAATARHWFKVALASRRPGEGFAGYVAFGPKPGTSEQGWIADPGFLVGAAGLTLAFLTAVDDDVDPTWDRVLLTSPAPWRAV